MGVGALCGGLALTATLLICGLFYASWPWHDLTLWRMEQALATTRHPMNTSVVKEKTIFGSQYLDSEDCTYFVGQFRTTSLQPDEVVQAYRDKTVTLFGFASNMPVQVTVIDADTSFPLGHPVDMWLSDLRGYLSALEGDETYYFVYILEENRLWFGDVRCYETGLTSVA